MNTRFSYNLLQLFTKKRPAGFALPLVVMTGTVILVVGAAMMVKGTNDQNQAVSKVFKQRSEGATEAGLAQMQGFLLGSKFMALYPKSKWESGISVDASTGAVTINDADLQQYVTTVATSLAGLSASGTTNPACSTVPPTQTQITTQENSVKSALKNIRSIALNGKNLDPGDPGKGAFRLTQFEYEGHASDTGESYYPPAGTSWLARMTIEGEVPGKKAKTTTTVTIPISVTPESEDTPFDLSSISPGLWVKNGGINSHDRPETYYDDSAGYVDGDVAISDCDGNVSDAYLTSLNDAQTARGYKAYRTDSPMPSAPPVPSGVTPYSITSSSVSLPRSGEVAAADGYYYYQRNGDLDDLTIDHTDNKKYRIYVSGNIGSGTGNNTINSNCDSTSGCVATDLQIFGMGSTGRVCMSGNDNRQVSAFVLAPNYDMGKNGNGNFVGTFIVGTYGKFIQCVSNNGGLAITSTQPSGSVPNEFTEIGSSAYPMPTIGSVNQWQALATDSTGTISSYTDSELIAMGGKPVSEAPVATGVTGGSTSSSSSGGSPTDGTVDEVGEEPPVVEETPVEEIAQQPEEETPVEEASTTIAVQNRSACDALNGTYFQDGSTKLCTYVP